MALYQGAKIIKSCNIIWTKAREIPIETCVLTYRENLFYQEITVIDLNKMLLWLTNRTEFFGDLAIDGYSQLCCSPF